MLLRAAMAFWFAAETILKLAALYPDCTQLSIAPNTHYLLPADIE